MIFLAIEILESNVKIWLIYGKKTGIFHGLFPYLYEGNIKFIYHKLIDGELT